MQLSIPNFLSFFYFRKLKAVFFSPIFCHLFCSCFNSVLPHTKKTIVSFLLGMYKVRIESSIQIKSLVIESFQNWNLSLNYKIQNRNRWLHSKNQILSIAKSKLLKKKIGIETPKPFKVRTKTETLYVLRFQFQSLFLRDWIQTKNLSPRLNS